MNRDDGTAILSARSGREQQRDGATAGRYAMRSLLWLGHQAVSEMTVGFTTRGANEGGVEG